MAIAMATTLVHYLGSSTLTGKEQLFAGHNWNSTIQGSRSGVDGQIHISLTPPALCKWHTIAISNCGVTGIKLGLIRLWREREREGGRKGIKLPFFGHQKKMAKETNAREYHPLNDWEKKRYAFPNQLAIFSLA